MTSKSSRQEIPTFDLQKHHNKVKMPSDFDLKDYAIKYHIFPLKVVSQNHKRRLLLAMRNPQDQELIDEVEFRAGMIVIPVQADEVDIQWLIQKYYYGRPLNPTAIERPHEVTHDIFEQLAITTDAQARPEWITDVIESYVEPSLKK